MPRDIRVGPSGRFKVIKKIGSGSFGDIYRGLDTETGSEVAVKFEPINVTTPTLQREAELYVRLQQAVDDDEKVVAAIQRQVSGEPMTREELQQTKDTMRAAKDVSVTVTATPQEKNLPMSLTSQSSLTSVTSHPPGLIRPPSRFVSLGRTIPGVSAPVIGGIPEIYYTGREGHFNLVVMELLSASLESLHRSCKQFSLKTTCRLALQCIARVRWLHSHGLLHRDIKPDNFMLGSGDRSHIIYIIDLGLSKVFRDPITKRHIPCETGRTLGGTARFVSLNVHKGLTPSRRDEMESLGYLFVLFAKGTLPWNSVQGTTKEEQYAEMAKLKENTPLAEICSGLPDAFEKYLSMCRSLDFAEKPDYAQMGRLWSDLYMSLEQDKYDAAGVCVFDWMSEEAKEQTLQRKLAENISDYSESDPCEDGKTPHKLTPLSHPSLQPSIQEELQDDTAADFKGHSSEALAGTQVVDVPSLMVHSAVSTQSDLVGAAVDWEDQANAAVAAAAAAGARRAGAGTGGAQGFINVAPALVVRTEPVELVAVPLAEWQPDEDAQDCYCCKKTFSLFKRRHHCRACGMCVCADCSGIKQEIKNAQGPVRVCVFCHLSTGLHAQSSPSQVLNFC